MSYPPLKGSVHVLFTAKPQVSVPSMVASAICRAWALMARVPVGGYLYFKVASRMLHLSFFDETQASTFPTN